MIGSPAKRLGVALLGTALIAGALFIAATGERADVGAALLGILPFGLGMLMFAAAKRPAPGSRSGMDIRLVDGHSATVFAISVGRAVLVALGFVFVALAGVGMAIFSETLDDPTTLRIAGIALALLFGGLALRMALLFRRGAVGEIILSPGGLDLRGGSEGTAVPWDAVREVSEANVGGRAVLGLEVSDPSAIRGSDRAMVSEPVLVVDLAWLQADPDLLVAAVRHAVEEPHDRAILGSAEAPEAIVRWCREDRLRSDPR